MAKFQTIQKPHSEKIVVLWSLDLTLGILGYRTSFSARKSSFKKPTPNFCSFFNMLLFPSTLEIGLFTFNLPIKFEKLHKRFVWRSQTLSGCKKASWELSSGKVRQIAKVFPASKNCRGSAWNFFQLTKNVFRDFCSATCMTVKLFHSTYPRQLFIYNKTHTDLHNFHWDYVRIRICIPEWHNCIEFTFSSFRILITHFIFSEKSHFRQIAWSHWMNFVLVRWEMMKWPKTFPLKFHGKWK